MGGEPTTSSPIRLSFVIATRGRPEQLAATIENARASIGASDNLDAHEFIVVDDHSDAEAHSALHSLGKIDRLIRTHSNVGVEAFNIGAAHAAGEFLVVLDDDAWPDRGAVRDAVGMLRADPALAAVALHPKHPTSRDSEWSPLGELPRETDRWPLIGPGSVIRAAAWSQVGGFESGFFLYANDTDLALKLLGHGWGVGMRPDLIVWHDSPTARRRPRRWFFLAVRNRIWTMRRHASGLESALFCVGAWMEAHARARADPASHALALAGAAAGFFRRPPSIPSRSVRGSDGVRTLWSLRRRRGVPARVSVTSGPDTPPGLPSAAINSVTAIVPSFNRHHDVELLLADLARCLHSLSRFRVVVIDNGSQPSLSGINTPNGLNARFLRLEVNSGGSGGFSAGLDEALTDAPDAVWLLDSDVRVGRQTLRRLIGALHDRPGLSAAGSAMIDPATRRMYEIGGQVDRRTAHYRPAASGRPCGPLMVDAEYLAATSLLVRAEAVRRTGLFPDAFLNGDDVEWTIRVREATRGRLCAVSQSVVTHPMGQSPTLARYYQSLNAFRPGVAVGAGLRARLVRASIEPARAFAVALYGRPDLSRLHIRGLSDARARRAPRPPASLALKPTEPARDAILRFAARGFDRVALHPRLRLSRAGCESLASELENAGMMSVAAALRRHRSGPLRRPHARDFLRAGLRVIQGGAGPAMIAPFDEHPSVWAAAGCVLLVSEDRAEIIEGAWRRRVPRAAALAMAAAFHGFLTALRPPPQQPLPAAGTRSRSEISV